MSERASGVVVHGTERGANAPEDDEAANPRRYARVPVRMSVRISTIEPERDPWTGRPFFRSIQESCANVSRGGAFVTTAEPLDPGKRVLVELRLPTGRELEAIGRVAWVKRVIGPKGSEPESGIGIEFLGGGNQELAALEDYISSNLDE
jgi:Tfp pilus assembly protein PilZ